MPKTNSYSQNINSYNSFGAKKYQQNWGDSWQIDKVYIDKFISLLKGNRVVDLGAGTGSVVEYFQQKALNPTYLDFSDSMISLATHKLKKIPIIKANLISLPIVDKSFDGVFSRYTLQHILLKDYQKALSEIFRITKPKGVVYICTHIRKEGEPKRSFYKWPGSKHKISKNLMTENRLEKMIINTGFGITHKYLHKDSQGITFILKKNTF